MAGVLVGMERGMQNISSGVVCSSCVRGEGREGG